MLSIENLFLIISLTVNVSVGLYFFGAPSLMFVLSKKKSSFCQRSVKMYKEKPRLIRKIFRDMIFTALLFGFGIYCVTSESTVSSRLQDTPSTFLFAFSVYVGNYVYKFLQDLLLRKEHPLYRIDLLHHFVTATGFAVLIVYKQNAVSGLIGLLFEGSVLMFDLNRLIGLFGANSSGFIVLWCSVLRVVFTVLLRAVCPTTLLVITISSHSPLTMDYLPLGYFFTNIVFFSMINGWLIKISFDGLMKHIWTRRLLYQLTRARENSNNDLNSISLGPEINNSSSQHQTSHGPLPVIIPTDANFRLLPPVSNVNVNCEEVSNIAISRHERTLPQFDVIIHDAVTSSPDAPVNQV